MGPAQALQRSWTAGQPWVRQWWCCPARHDVPQLLANSACRMTAALQPKRVVRSQRQGPASCRRTAAWESSRAVRMARQRRTQLGMQRASWNPLRLRRARRERMQRRARRAATAAGREQPSGSRSSARAGLILTARYQPGLKHGSQADQRRQAACWRPVSRWPSCQTRPTS